MRTTQGCDCGRADCPCIRLDCDYGWLPEVVTETEGRLYTSTPPCPDCRGELHEILTTAANPQAVLRSRTRTAKRAKGEKLAYRRRYDPVFVAAATDRERQRADLNG